MYIAKGGASKVCVVFLFPADLDLRTVCYALGTIKTKWFNVGIELGIPRSKLLEFKDECDPLSAVVDYWLKGNVTEAVVSISWKSIVKALKSENVGEPELAEEISKKYCPHEDTTKSKGQSNKL